MCLPVSHSTVSLKRPVTMHCRSDTETWRERARDKIVITTVITIWSFSSTIYNWSKGPSPCKSCKLKEEHSWVDWTEVHWLTVAISAKLPLWGHHRYIHLDCAFGQWDMAARVLLFFSLQIRHPRLYIYGKKLWAAYSLKPNSPPEGSISSMMCTFVETVWKYTLSGMFTSSELSVH